MKISELDKDYVVNEYRSGVPLHIIGNRLGTTHHTIKRLLKSIGEPLRSKRESHRISFPYTDTGETYHGRKVYKSKKGRLCVFSEKDGMYRTANTICRDSCHHCGKEYLRAANDAKKRACSDKCRGALLSGKNNTQWVGVRSRKSTGYILIYSPDHPAAHHNKVPEHRLVMEKFLNRYLSSDEIVHHINGIKDDNTLENLCLCSKSEHTIAHNSIIPLISGLLNDGIIQFDQNTKCYKRCK